MTGPLKPEHAALLESGWFDPEWYRDRYPDVDVVGIDPAEHYLCYGYRLNRDPGPGLCTRFVRRAYKMRDEHEPIARLKWLQKGREGDVQPDPNWVLKAAHDVACAGDPDRAVALGETFLPPELAYTAHVLRANAALTKGDTATWLNRFNAYLDHYKIAPVQLEGTGPIFSRLSSTRLASITGGPLISVLMPAWNAEKTLRKAVQSILDQTWRNLELLIVDDASTDRTWKILQEIAARDSRVKIFRNRVNVGPYVSKNIAFTQARGDWVTGHDADDWAHPQRLEKHVKYCERKGLKASVSGMLRMSEDGFLVRLNRIGGYVHDGACRSAFISLMIRSQYLRDILGGWDTVRTSGDSEIINRIQALENREIQQFKTVSMICLDNPEGLTNHPTLGYAEGQPVSPARLEYKRAFTAWQSGLSRETARIDLCDRSRRFEAPAEIAVSPSLLDAVLDGHRSDGLRLTENLDVDVAIVTNTGFSGGNASSTIDELSHLTSSGLSCALIHCPPDKYAGALVSGRYADHRDNWYNWRSIERLKARVLICRHPLVVTSASFAYLQERMSVGHAFIVKNNSTLGPMGTVVYDEAEMVRKALTIRADDVVFCPIGPLMRAELADCRARTGLAFRISELDWTPTFDIQTYVRPPKPSMGPRFRIGRHGRDGPEKWLEDKDALSRAYPEHPDFSIVILGGASRAETILQRMPSNWTVHEFGKIEPADYLGELDAFVYFPNSTLIEAFGRIIIEAMLAGVPVILPRRFEATFGDLPLYCEPHQVADLVRRLTRDDAARVAWLTEVQQIAVARFSSRVIARRLAPTGLPGLAEASADAGLSLSSGSRDYRNGLVAAAGVVR